MALRPYSDDASRAPSKMMPTNRKRAFAVAASILVIVGLFVEDPATTFVQFGRRLAVQCVHNAYAHTPEMALDMPRVPHVTASAEIPSYIGICQEWIRRGAGASEPTYTQEDDAVCMDWTAPHYRMMEIVAASILDRINGRSRYRHDCYRSRTWDEAVTGELGSTQIIACIFALMNHALTHSLTLSCVFDTQQEWTAQLFNKPCPWLVWNPISLW